MIFFNGKVCLSLFVIYSLVAANPEIQEKNKTVIKSRKLYSSFNPKINSSDNVAILKAKRGGYKKPLVKRKLQDETPVEESVTPSEESLEKIFDSPLETTGDINTDTSSSNTTDPNTPVFDANKVREILSANDIEILATVSYNDSNGSITADVKVLNYKIIAEPSDVNLESGSFNVLITVTDTDGKLYSDNYIIEDGVLKEVVVDNQTTQNNEPTQDVTQTTLTPPEIEPVIAGPVVGVLVVDDETDVSASQIEITNDKLTGEEPQNHFEEGVVSGTFIVSKDNNNIADDVVVDHGEVKVLAESSINNPTDSQVDFSHDHLTDVTLIEETPTAEIAYKAEIENDAIVNNGSTDPNLLTGDHNLTALVHEDGKPEVHHIDTHDGVITNVDGIPINTEVVELPVAELAGNGIIMADAVIETPEGLVAEPVVFNNGQLVQEPENSHLAEGSADVDLVLHDNNEVHAEHAHLEDGYVTEVIADIPSNGGVAYEGEEHVDVLTKDENGIHVEEILVKDDHIVEEPSNMDLEHGEHVIDTLIHDQTGPHVEHWKVEEGIIVSHHAEEYLQIRSNPQNIHSNSSEIKHSLTQSDSGTVHVEMLLNYGQENSLQNVLMQNGMIVQESPGIDLMHGIHIAEAITKGVLGPQVQPVVIHDGFVEPTTTNPVQEQIPLDITNGDFHAKIIEGDGSEAKIDNVELHNGKITEYSGPVDLMNGTHVVETIVEDGETPHIETDVIVDGIVTHPGPKVEDALILMNEGDNTSVTEVKIQENHIIEQSEGEDLTQGVHVADEIKLNDDGSVDGTEKVVIDNGEVSVLDHPTLVEPDTNLSSEKDALFVVDHDGTTLVDQIHVKDNLVTSQSGPVDLSGHEQGIEIDLDSTTHNVKQAEEVVVDNYQIIPVNPDQSNNNAENLGVQVESPVIENQDSNNYDLTTYQTNPVQVESNQNDSPVNSTLFESNSSTPVDNPQAILPQSTTDVVGRKTYMRPFVYKPSLALNKYDQLNKRGLYSPNNAIKANYMNRIGLPNSLVQNSRVKFDKNMTRPLSYQPRQQNSVNRLAAYDPSHTYNFKNIPANRIQNVNKNSLINNLGRRTLYSSGKYNTSQPVNRLNSQSTFTAIRPQFNGSNRVVPSQPNFRPNILKRSHFLKI